MVDSMTLLTNLTQMGSDPSDARMALGMLFDFDAVFNQKTEELLIYGLGLRSKQQRAKVSSDELLKAYKNNLSDDFKQNLWLKFKVCFQLVELVLRIRDRIIFKNKMKPILNGLYWVQEYSANLRN